MYEEIDPFVSHNLYRVWYFVRQVQVFAHSLLEIQNVFGYGLVGIILYYQILQDNSRENGF